MKKKIVFSVLIIMTLSVLSSCDVLGGMDLTDLNRGYSFNAEIMYEKETTRGSFTRNSEGVWEGNMTDPYALQGIRLGYNCGEVTMQLSDFSIVINSDTPDSIAPAPTLMLDAFEKAILKDNVSVSVNNDCVEVKGTLGDDDYTLVFTKHNNIPVSLEIPKKKLKVIFTEAIVGDLKNNSPIFDSEDDIISDQ